VAKLTADLPSEDARLDGVIAQRVEAYTKASGPFPGIGSRAPDTAHGQQLFQQNCAACHRLKGQGGNVGPNLDGVAARGVYRLVEDILDPNRNVDPAFRQTIVETADGRVLMGVNPRADGQLLVLNDATGNAISVPKSQVKTQTQSRLSLMPPTFEQAIQPADFNDLLHFLLTQSTSTQ
jgi:putative heme-binding domain-containing protein